MMQSRLVLLGGSLLAVLAVVSSAVMDMDEMPGFVPHNELLKRCCKPQNKYFSEKDLLQCSSEVMANSPTPEHASKQVSFVSYATENIRDYAAYSLSINAAYCHAHNYEFRILDDQSPGSQQYDHRDQRWNKVRILLDALEGWASDREFVVWLDADLVVLDHDFRIDTLLAQATAEQDILVCEDPEPAEIFSIVNTGSVIVRNTQWSRDFLRRWWGNLSDRAGWDQHVFTTMYQESAAVREKVHLLPADAFNTRRPATLYHHQRCPVLHMVGAVVAHRQAVFKESWEMLCQSYDMQLPPITQLGLHKSNLVRLEKQVLGTRQRRAEDLVNTITGTPPTELATYKDFKQLKIDHQMEVVMKLGEPRVGAPADVSMVLQAMKHYYKLLKRLIASDTLGAGECREHDSDSSNSASLADGAMAAMKVDKADGNCDYTHRSTEDLLQSLIDMGFELALPPAKPFYKRQLMQEMEPYIDQLLSTQSPNSSREIQYLEFKRKQFLAQTYHTDDPDNNVDRAKEVVELEGALDVWNFMYGTSDVHDEAALQEMKQSRGSGGHWEDGAEVLDTLGILYCITDDHNKGLAAAARGAALIEGHWDLRSVLHFSRNDLIPGSVRGWDEEIMGYLEMVPPATLLGLAQTYKNMAYCAYQYAQAVDSTGDDGEPVRKRALKYAEYAALIRLDLQILTVKREARTKGNNGKGNVQYDDSVSSQRALQQHAMDKKQREENEVKIAELMTIVNSLTGQSPVQARFKLLERERERENKQEAAKDVKKINRRKKSKVDEL